MKYGIYVIRDLKVGYMGLTLDLNDQSAMRNFEHAMSKEDSLMFSHPKDFSLYCLGMYDSDTGEVFGPTNVSSWRVDHVQNTVYRS